MGARKAKPNRAEPPRPPPVPAGAPRGGGRGWTLASAAAIVAAGVLAYSNSFLGEYLFDDFGTVVDNRSIRRLWPLEPVLRTPRETSVSARPLLNLSFALNYAAAEAMGLHGLDVRGYHVTNVAIHILAALTLMGIIRRVLLSEALRDRFGRSARPLALAGAMLWLLHPLQTASVSYITQRAESLMGLLYLLTVYCALRGLAGPPRVWCGAAVLACALGMASKEVMVSAPILVLLIDRALVSGSWRQALRRHWGLHAALAGTWAVLVACVLSSTRSRSAGFGLGMTSWEYLRTQAGVILHYLRLSFWPHPLIVDYSWPVPRSAWGWLPQGLAVLGLAGLTGAGLWRNRPAALAGAAFFLVLGPSSSVIPIITEVAAEHRMYLPLAAVIVTVLSGVCRLGEAALGRLSATPATRRGAALAGAASAAALTVLLGALTYGRNRDYRSELAIWEDNVAKQPLNLRARCSLGAACENVAHRIAQSGPRPEVVERLVQIARQQYEQVLRIDPNHPEALGHMGEMLVKWYNRLSEALEYYERVIQVAPDIATAHSNRAMILDQLGRRDQALEAMRETVRRFPDHVVARHALGLMLFQRGQYAEAIPHYEQAVRLEPLAAEYRSQLAETYARTGQFGRAVQVVHEALRTAAGQEPATRRTLGGQLELYRAGRTMSLPTEPPGR